MRQEPAGHMTIAGVEVVAAQDDILTGNLVLHGAGRVCGTADRAPVVVADHARIGHRAL